MSLRPVSALFASTTALWLLPAQALSQPPDVRIAPTVWIAPAQGLSPIRLDTVSIDVQVAGFIARTRMELVFDNPNDRVLEGEFVFPLGAGQTVAGYELEVEGRLRAGVVVPKETARVAFEDITRQQVDPGLAELTRGNVFRTRLYPIPARGRKRIALTFEQALVDAGNDYRYVLPLSFDQPVRRFAVHAQADVGASAVFDEGQSPDAQLRFERSQLAWVAAFEQTDITPRSELAFKVPKVPGTPILEAADSLEPEWRSVVAQIDTGLPEKAVATARPDRVAIFYDASGSARDRDREREMAMIERYLNDLGDVEVVLIPFRNVMETPMTHRIRAGDTGAVIEAIRTLPLDGGSSYGAIDTTAAPGATLILVVGDGLSNFGSHEPRIGASSASTINVIHASQQADHARLAQIARKGGGRVIDLLQVTADQAVTALSTQPWQLLSMASADGSCRDFSPQAPDAVGRSVIVTARCRGKTAFNLIFGRRGEKDVTRTIHVGEGSPVEGVLADSVHRLWAQARIAALDAGSQADRDAIVALGTRYGVVTRHTSLLVLDRIEDYVRYGIEPKDDDLRAAYRAAIASQLKPIADPGRAERLRALVTLWQEFRQWHGTRHPWLETVLVPAADDELMRWNSVLNYSAIAGRRVKERIEMAEAISAQSRELLARWPTDGADPTTRTGWEREAAALMQRITSLRQQRIALAPASDRDYVPVALASPTDGGGQQTLDRVEVSGSRLEAEALPAELAPLPNTTSPPPPPSPEQNRGLDDVRQDTAHAAAPSAIATGAGVSPVDAGVSSSATIELRGWNPDTPYLKAMRNARDAYAAYLVQRDTHGNTPAFFLDSADYFRDEAKKPELALRVLSNIAEISIENTELTRVLAYRLAQWDLYALAVGQFEYALEQRPEEPQSYRDLALALSRQPNPDIARAVELLWAVATRDWHGRFPEIELIALHELNAILAAAPDDSAPDLAALGIPVELIDPLAVGLRVVMTWDADNTDIDLWVIDPAGEKAFYSYPRTQTGGRMSRDFTEGYGPEVFVIRRPLPGAYRVQANYFGDRRQSLTGPVTVQIEFQTRFGEALTERKAITRRLESGREVIDLGEFVVALD